jgi:hypothetical protein
VTGALTTVREHIARLRGIRARYPESLSSRIRQRLFANVLSTMNQQPGPDYERGLANIENPIIVPSRRSVLDAADTFLARDEALSNLIMSQDINGRDPNRQYIEGAEYDALSAAQRYWEDSVRDLLVALMAGGRPPWRWTVRRWARHVLWLRWYLREGAGGDAWASARRRRAQWPEPGMVDEPPF